MKKSICLNIVLFIFGLVPLLVFPLFSGQQEIEQKPEVKDFGGFWYAYMDFKGPYSLVKEKSQVFLKEFVDQGLTAQSPFLVVYYNSPKECEPEKYEWATCFQIADDAEVKPPLQKRKLEKHLSVIIMHYGPIEEIQKSNDIATAFIDENGYKKMWPNYEIFHKSPSRVEIIYPVEKLENK